MSYAEVHLKGGSVARFEVTELSVERNTFDGTIRSIKWTQPEGAKVRPVSFLLEEIAAALFVEEELFPASKLADLLVQQAAEQGLVSTE